MADVVRMLHVVVRMWSASPEKINIPPRSELLGGWCLPMMSSSLAAAEKEQEAIELFESVQRLKAKQDAKQ